VQDVDDRALGRQGHRLIERDLGSLAEVGRHQHPVKAFPVDHGRTRHQHAGLARPHHPLGHAAEKEPLQPGATVGTQDHQRSVDLPGGAAERLDHGTLAEPQRGRDAVAGEFPGDLLQALAPDRQLLLHQPVETLEVASRDLVRIGRDHGHRRSVRANHPGTQVSRQHTRDAACCLTAVGEVGREQDRRAHEGLLLDRGTFPATWQDTGRASPEHRPSTARASPEHRPSTDSALACARSVGQPSAHRRRDRYELSPL
jgi:hypothetical protein